MRDRAQEKQLRPALILLMCDLLRVKISCVNCSIAFHGVTFVAADKESIVGRAVKALFMSAEASERIIVSVGGSLIVPDQIDTDFLSRFRALILEKLSQGFTFSIIAGGGKLA